jgi:hypothetical protein
MAATATIKTIIGSRSNAVLATGIFLLVGVTLNADSSDFHNMEHVDTSASSQAGFPCFFFAFLLQLQHKG